jgi:D-alanyl-lipoteichoic acid acyltransferase DltB (MBOAT superfamily)
MTTVDASLDEAAPARTSELGRFLSLALQLFLVLWVVDRFELERGRGLPELSPLIFGGFVIHAWLPKPWRMPFFLGLSLAGFLLVFGAALGGALVGIGLVLIGICHLPAPWWLRITLLLGAGAALTAMRADLIDAPWAVRILPVLGSIFMFRLVLYVYDLRTEESAATPWQRLSYFFLLPNVLFPLFPIIDYKTFLRTWYARADHLIHAKGVDWISRGVIQLLLYRLIYRAYTPPIEAVGSIGMAVIYMLSAYLLYLRVSGLFHLIVGVLALFGFDLPETHHRWALASGFNDLWRRINIYWKDFMMKIVYYPIFIRMRRKDPTRAMVVATLVVFLVSWLLHSYQWFWIRGSFPLTVVDAIFWILFAVAVLANSLLQARGGARRASLTQRQVTRRQALVHALKVTGMFSFMCVFWSFWTGNDLATFGELLEASARGPLSELLALLALLATAVIVGVVYQLNVQVRWERWQAKRSFSHRALGNIAVLLALLAFGTPSITGLEDNVSADALRSEGLNAQDQELMLRGYYEEILVGEQHLGLMSDIASQTPDHWVKLLDTDAARRMDEGILEFELLPDVELEYHEALLTTNRWAMRDQDYAKEKAPGTCRIALLGASIEMGSGVTNDEVFEAVTERMLNEANPGTTWERFEILNFAMNGYSMLMQIEVLGRKALGFEPDYVFVFAHGLDDRLLRVHLERAMRDEVVIPYPWLTKILEEGRLEHGLPKGRMRKSFELVQDELMAQAYRSIQQRATQHGARSVWIFLQHPPVPSDFHIRRVEGLQELADVTGFTTIRLDNDRIYHDGKDWETLVLRPWDDHPNPQGHRNIAEELFRQMQLRSDELGLGLH